MDAMNSLHSTTFEIDEKHGTDYHKRFLEFVKMVQRENLVIGGAMTDPKGDRSKGPAEQDDPDLFTRIVDTDDRGSLCLWCKSTPNWMYQFPLDNFDANNSTN